MLTPPDDARAASLTQLAEEARTLRGLTTGTLDRVVPWVHAAARSLLHERGAQLPLPGLSG